MECNYFRLMIGNSNVFFLFRRVSFNQPKHDGIKSRTKTVNQRLGTSPETFHSSVNSRFESALLFHFHQLPQKRIRTENVDESKQKIMG